MKLIAPVLALVMLMLTATPASFAVQKGDQSPERKALQARFESRYPQIIKLKAEGKIGETSEGFLDVVKDDASARKLVDEENRDRKALYALIAKDEGIDADVVATRAAKRNFEKAKKGEFLKENGAWRQK